MRSSVKVGLAACLALAGQALAQDAPPPDRIADSTPVYDEVGYATWYGAEMAGNRTASGAPFDPSAFTAAHRKLPLGSYVEVTALDTGRTVLVLVNDRGPFTPGLSIDLSRAAAKAIGVVGRKAVRIRRVTPSLADQKALRSGRAGAVRLNVPPVQLATLRSRLGGGARVAAVTPMARWSTPTGSSLLPAMEPMKAMRAGRAYYVQYATFGSRHRAGKLAQTVGGVAVPAGSRWSVRSALFADAKSALQARDAAAARGYGDARVVRED